MQKILNDLIQELEFPDVVKTGKAIKIGSPAQAIVIQKKDTILLSFLKTDIEGRVVKTHGYLNTIEFPVDFDFQKLIYKRKGIALSFYNQFNAIFSLVPKKVDSIKIIYGDEIRYTGRTLILPVEQIDEILIDCSDVFKRGKSSKASTELYHNNILKRKYLNATIKPVTTIRKGDFDMFVNRMNIDSKNNAADFKKHLTFEDIQALQDFFMKLFKVEVFENDFVKLIDDYVIKEKLRMIIELGRQIINLKSEDLKTKTAKEIVKQLGGKDIKQLETVWQKYFEKYLLYLVFSYQKIYPKIEFTLESSKYKRKPDFVGVNHYSGIDIIEIKTHIAHALIYDSSHENFAFSPELSKAIIQTMNYMDALMHSKIKNKGTLSDIKAKLLEGNIYRPQGLIIISSSERIVKNLNSYNREDVMRDFTKLRNGLSNIQILTFDEVLDTAERYSQNFVTQ